MNRIPGINLIYHSIRPQGGMDRHALNLISSFSSRGIPLRVIARAVDWTEKPEDVEFVRLRDPTPFSRFNNIRFERCALEFVKPNWPIVSISRVMGRVDLAISGGTHKVHLRDKGKDHPGFFDQRVIANEETLYANAGAIVAHSRQTQSEIIQEYGIDPARVKALYPPVDVGAFNLKARENREQTRKKIGVAPDRFMVLFPSNDHERKGAKLILDAIEGLDERLVLVVAGKAPLNHPAVLNLGFCPDMPSVYAAADVTVLASIYEPFGMVGPESVLCGTPVLLADTIGAVEVLTEPACFSFAREAEVLRSLLLKMMKRFESGELELVSPERYIHYAYSFDAYLDELIGLLAS